MTLHMTEIAPGAVAYLSGRLLASDPRIWQPLYRTDPFIDHPFLCVGEGNGCSIWLSLTSNQNPQRKRLELPASWREGGTHGWKLRQQFVHNMRNPYCGSNRAFIGAGVRESLLQGCSRPKVNARGMEVILAEFLLRNDLDACLQPRRDMAKA